MRSWMLGIMLVLFAVPANPSFVIIPPGSIVIGAAPAQPYLFLK